jgi:hypothetical protein
MEIPYTFHNSIASDNKKQTKSLRDVLLRGTNGEGILNKFNPWFRSLITVGQQK